MELLSSDAVLLNDATSRSMSCRIQWHVNRRHQRTESAVFYKLERQRQGTSLWSPAKDLLNQESKWTQKSQ